MTNINWDLVKFRASSWGNLLAEPQSKADKDAGRLGVTCQKELIKIYNLVKYGRKKNLTTNAMDKGKQLQTEGIKLFSFVENELYEENNEQLEDEWFTGTLDMFSGKDIRSANKVWDLKCSYELDTFTPRLIESPDKGYDAQLNVYYSLTGAEGGGLAYVLLDAPPSVLADEKRRLLYNMDVVSEESPAYLQAAAELERLLTFPDIHYTERVIKQPVERNEELIEKMKSKVPIFRQWLHDFDKKHMSQYPKQEKTDDDILKVA